MADTKRKIGAGDIALLVLSVFFAVGMFTIFAPCGPKEDGSWMVCHWAGNAVKGLAVVLAVLSVAHVALRDSRIKAGLDLAIIPVTLFAAVLPGNVIGLCMMKTMKCHTVTHPAVIVVSALIIIAAVADILLQRRVVMKKLLVSAVVSAFALASLTSCGDDSVYVLGNIPFAEFFASEADSFDALSSATVKAASGNLSYGTYHEKADAAEKSTFSGITFPVKVSKSALEKSGFTQLTDETGATDVTVTIKGKEATTRYTGKQNLYQSGNYSYYILNETPAYYKEATLKGGKLSFGKIVGTAKDLGTLYVAVKADPKHTKGFEYALFTDAGKTALSFSDADSAQAVSGDSLSPAKLNTVRAIIAKTSDGKTYGLTALKNVWQGKEFGAAADAEIAGKTIASLTFVTENGLYTAQSFVLGTSEKIDGKTVVTFADGAQTVSEFKAEANYKK